MAEIRYMPWSKRRAILRKRNGYPMWMAVKRDGVRRRVKGTFRPSMASRALKYKNYINRS